MNCGLTLTCTRLQKSPETGRWTLDDATAG